MSDQHDNAERLARLFEEVKVLLAKKEDRIQHLERALLIAKENPTMILLTHTVTMIVKADPDMDIQDQLRELEINCEAAADYAFSRGSYTQDTECTIEHFAECAKATIITT